MSAANERRLEKQLQRIPDADLDRLEDAIEGLSETPRPQGIEQLKPNIYRLRVGNWRVIYQVRDATREVVVGGVRRRNERTYVDIDALFA